MFLGMGVDVILYQVSYAYACVRVVSVCIHVCMCACGYINACDIYMITCAFTYASMCVRVRAQVL